MTALAGQVGGDPSEVTVLVDQQSAASLPSTPQAEIHVDVASADEAKDDEDSDGIPVGSTTPLPDWTDADEKRHHLQYNEFKSKWLRYDYVDPQNGRTVKGVASPQTYHLVGTKYLDRESTLYKFWFAYYERTLRLPAADAQDSRSFGWKAPKFTREMYRELMVAATLLLRNDASRAMFLREMWVREYGDCRDNICCLKYDINAPGCTYFGTCRHWEYYSKMHVYLDRFASDGDYRLALALASHLEMMAATDPDKMGKPESSKDRVKLEVAACMMAHQVTTKLPRNKAEQTVEHLEPLLGSLTAILFSDAMNADVRCRRVPLFAWDFGDLVVEEDDGDRVLGRAILCRVDTNLLLTKADVDVVNRNKRRLVWVPCTNVMNYARRLFAAEGTTTDAKPFITKLRLRDATTTPRSQSEVSRALSTPQWHDACRLDQDQRDVVRRIVTEKGIMLVRGPYGCGKTTTLTSTVATYHAAYPDERIAIVSETNAAINEDLWRLVEGNMVNKRLVLRLGECEPTMKGFRDVYLSELCAEERARLRHLELPEDVVRREVNKFEQKKLEQARIIVATLSITGRTDYQVRTLQFDLVINDEGAQTTETAVIQALRIRTHSLASFGDHNQLLGFSPLPEHQLDQFSEGDRRHKITWSLHHSFAHHRVQHQGEMGFPGLTVQVVFRSHPKITKFLQPFYDYPLRQGRTILSKDYLKDMALPPLEEGQTVHVGEDRVVWIGSEREALWSDGTKKKKNEEKYCNHIEAALVIDLLLRVKATLKKLCVDDGGDWMKKRVLVVTPYQEQKEMLVYLCRKLASNWGNYLQVEVHIVDSSQGREADVVIVSMMRHVNLGFMKNTPSRALVALSRAREYLFLLACRPVFERDEMWRNVGRNADALKVNYHDSSWTTETARALLRNEDHQRAIGYVGDQRQ